MHYPLVIIGAGAAGLVIAIGAAKAKKKVLLIEKGNYGGDCTNFGCIPSKSLIAASDAVHVLNHASIWGVTHTLSSLKTEETLERVRRIVKQIRSSEEPDSLKKLGVDTLTGSASFVDPNRLSVKTRDATVVPVSADQIVIATGSSPLIPQINGLSACHFYTNETIFDLERIPKRLGIIGGGPIGCELGQCFQRLGSQVYLIHNSCYLLQKEEKEAQSLIKKVFTSEGIDVRLFHEIKKMINKESTITLLIKSKTSEEEAIVEVDKLLIATGRKPCIDELNLNAIGVVANQKGIVVDDYCRTKHKHIFAVGDVVGRARFTHLAENEARTVLKNLLLPWPLRSKIDLKQAIPRVTFTDPEVASVGLSEKQAQAMYGKASIVAYIVPLSEVDRAITASRTEGFVKIVTKKWSSRILGATIVAPRAAEMLSQVTTAMHASIPLRKLSTLIHPYPTYNLAIRQAADQWLTKTILPAILKLLGQSE